MHIPIILLCNLVEKALECEVNKRGTKMQS